ncbi:MAG TPA: class I SAM-dependent methyltransferase [Candidatus Didemnitutus sp.]|nr:class I SAM-dependent methyltransferase [Candidatus Didemnitutus sp.]
MTPEWYASWFESPWYMRLYRHRTEEEAREAVDLVQRLAGVPHGSKVLDLCCGYGRHALALAEHGYQVTGLDNSHYLIDRARELYPHENVTYVVGDMRGPFPMGPFHAIANFFTSFGYFDTHEQNTSVLRAIRANLVDGGVFVMDFLNAKLLRSTLVAESMGLLDDVTVLQERWIDEPFVRKRITISNPCSYEQEFEERVWLYDKDMLVDMCIEAGLRVRSIHGWYDGAAFNEATSSRCIIVAEAI